MKRMTLAAIAIVGLAGATAQTAFASDNGWYVFGEVGQAINNNKSKLDNALTSLGYTGFASSENNVAVYNLNAGYQFNKNFALEGGYIASSHQNYSASGGNLPGTVTDSASVTGFDLSAVGILPLTGQFSLLGKLGVADMQNSATVTVAGLPSSSSASKTDLTYGLGAKYDFTDAVSMRLDWNSYNIGNSTSSTRYNVLGVGVGYKF